MGCSCGPFRTCNGKIYDENWEECIRCGHRQLKGFREDPEENDFNLDDLVDNIVKKLLSNFIIYNHDGNGLKGENYKVEKEELRDVIKSFLPVYRDK